MHPIFYFKKPSLFDKWSIGVYLVLTLGLAIYWLQIDNQANKSAILFTYGVITQFLIYGVLYKSLRNLTVFSIWLLIGLVHFYGYCELRTDVTLIATDGHSALPLRNTIPLLILFQFLRFISLKIQHQELVCPGKPSKWDKTDLYSEREINWLDYVLLVIYVACAIALNVEDRILSV